MSQLTCILQFGSSRISAAAAWRDDLGGYQVAAIESEPADGCVRRGCVVSVDDAAARVKLLMQKLNNRLRTSSVTLASADLRHASSLAVIDRVYVGVSGISLHSLPHEPSTLLPEGTTVTTEVLERLREQSLSTRLVGYDVVSVEPAGYVLDGEPTPHPAGRSGHTLTAHHQLIIGQTRLKAGFAAAVQKAGFRVAGYVVAPVATASAILTTDERNRGCVMVDMGASVTSVAVYADGVLRRLATIPLGGATVTRDVMSKGLRADEAELLKTQWGNASGEGDTAAEERAATGILHKLPLGELNSVITCRYEEILANVARQIELSGCEAYRLEGGCVLTGGAALQRGLAVLASQRLGIARVAQRCFTEFGYNQSERKPYYTSLMAMLLECSDDCRQVAVAPRPIPTLSRPAAQPSTPTDGQGSPAADPAEGSTATAATSTSPVPTPNAQPAATRVTPKPRKRNRFMAIMGDLFSSQDDEPTTHPTDNQ